LDLKTAQNEIASNWIEAYHFALDQKADEIAGLTEDFLNRQKR